MDEVENVVGELRPRETRVARGEHLIADSFVDVTDGDGFTVFGRRAVDRHGHVRVFDAFFAGIAVEGGADQFIF
jgi:hypothetical protein